METVHGNGEAEPRYADISYLVTDECKPLADAFQNCKYVTTSNMDDTIKEALLRDTLKDIFKDNKNWNENLASIVDWYFEIKKKYPYYFKCPLLFLDYKIFQFLMQRSLNGHNHNPDLDILHDNGIYKKKRAFYHCFLNHLYCSHGFANQIFDDLHDGNFDMKKKHLEFMRFFMNNKYLENPAYIKLIKDQNAKTLAELDFKTTFVKFAYSIIVIFRKFCNEFGGRPTSKLVKCHKSSECQRSTFEKFDESDNDDMHYDNDGVCAASNKVTSSLTNKLSTTVAGTNRMAKEIPDVSKPIENHRIDDAHDSGLVHVLEDPNNDINASVDVRDSNNSNNNDSKSNSCGDSDSDNKIENENESKNENESDIHGIHHSVCGGEEDCNDYFGVYESKELQDLYRSNNKIRRKRKHQTEFEYTADTTVYSQFDRNTESLLDLEIKRIVHGIIDDFEIYHQRFNSKLGHEKVNKILNDIKAIESDAKLSGHKEYESIVKLVNFWCQHFLIHTKINDNDGILHTLQQRIRARE